MEDEGQSRDGGERGREREREDILPKGEDAKSCKFSDDTVNASNCGWW
jgi:hypothetical protein